MSTVVLTPTHMACDHNVVRQTYPHRTQVELNHQKIFLSPLKNLLVGTVGEFLPEQIDQIETWEALAEIMIQVFAQLAIDGLINNCATLRDCKGLEYFSKIFDVSARTFLVTKHYRFIIWHSNAMQTWYVKEVGPYAGIGSGGDMATGLLLGGMPLVSMWNHLNKLDRLSSVEYTSFPLSMLKIHRNLNTQLKKLRDGQ